MATFMAWYSTGEYGKMWFDAENIEQARELLGKVQSGEISPDELPGFNFSVKGEGWEFDDLHDLDGE